MHVLNLTFLKTAFAYDRRLTLLSMPFPLQHLLTNRPVDSYSCYCIT